MTLVFWRSSRSASHSSLISLFYQHFFWGLKSHHLHVEIIFTRRFTHGGMREHRLPTRSRRYGLSYPSQSLGRQTGAPTSLSSRSVAACVTLKPTRDRPCEYLKIFKAPSRRGLSSPTSESRQGDSGGRCDGHRRNAIPHQPQSNQGVLVSSSAPTKALRRRTRSIGLAQTPTSQKTNQVSANDVVGVASR